jgi:hypothetical protein
MIERNYKPFKKNMLQIEKSFAEQKSKLTFASTKFFGSG